MVEPYIDERPHDDELTSSWISGGGGSGGGVWVGGEVGGGGQWQDDKRSLNYLRCVRGILSSQKGFLLLGTLPCSLAPPLLVTGLAEEHLSHYRCLCLRLNGELLHLKSAGPWHYHFLDVPLAEGTYTLTGKWQSGHYDYSEVSQVRIFLFGVDLGFVKLPLLKYTTVAVITKTATELTVNNFKGSYRGNDKFVENTQ